MIAALLALSLLAPGGCRPADGGYRLCGYPYAKGDSVIMLGTRWIAGPAYPDVRGRPDGWWRKVYLSPDRRTLLAQWSGECEVPETFFVPARGGKPRATTRKPNVESTALGWRRDGWALIRFPRGVCGSSLGRAGLYAVNPVTLRARFLRR